MTSLEYSEIRDKIKDGDVILFRSRRPLGRIIQYFDNAYYNHIGVAFIYNGRIFIMDSNADGVHPEFLSIRVKKYQQIAIMRPADRYKKNIDAALDSILDVAQEGIKYDFLMLPRIAVYRKLGIDISNLGDNVRDICSEWARRYMQALGCDCFDNDGKFVTPEDFIRKNSRNCLVWIYGTKK